MEIRGRTILEYQILQFNKSFPDADFHFAIDDGNQKIIEVISKKVGVKSCNIHKLPKGTKGAACSSLFVASELPQDDEIFIVSTNEFVNCDLIKANCYFKSNHMNGGVISFKSNVPKYSFVEKENNQVIGVYQYDAVTDIATAGLFWFSAIEEFCDAVKMMIMKGGDYEGNYYLAPCFNEMILLGKKIGDYCIASDDYCPLKSDNDIIQATLTLTNNVKLC